MRHAALNLLRQDRQSKRSVKAKRKLALGIRTIAKWSLPPVILSGAKNPIFSAETLRSAQGGNSSELCNRPALGITATCSPSSSIAC